MRYMKLLDKWFGFVFRKVTSLFNRLFSCQIGMTLFQVCGMRSLREDGIFSNIPRNSLKIWFSFLHPSPRVQVFPSLFFLRKHTPPGFASSTCRFWWAPCCRSSTLLPAVFSSSPPSWSAQDASPWGIGNGTGVLCVFLGYPKQNQNETSIDLNSSNVTRWVFLRVPLQSNPPKICCSSGGRLLSPMTRWLISLSIHSSRETEKWFQQCFNPSASVRRHQFVPSKDLHHAPPAGPKAQRRFQRSADSQSIRFPFPKEKDVTVYLAQILV